jgi:hypothetical protein
VTTILAWPRTGKRAERGGEEGIVLLVSSAVKLKNQQEVKLMQKDLLVIEVDCHTDAPVDIFVIRRIEIPMIDHLLYALPDKPDEQYTAKEFVSLNRARGDL